MRPLRVASLVVAASLIAAAADAQKKPKEPKRPKMEAGRDTNSAGAYYYWGLNRLRDFPREAQAAFYWASRLEPGWADPLYAQRIAYHMSDLVRFWKYLDGAKYVHKMPETKRMDSLLYRAMLRDPFLFRRHDKMLIDRLIQEATGDHGVIGGSARFLAWAAYSNTRFGEAVGLYAKAIAKDPEDYDLHAARARSFYHMGWYDSTVSEMTKALEGYRKEDEEDLVILYESKAMYELSIATALIQAKKLDAAREALGRALAEDLSFYVAHQRLAALSLAAGDTTTALSEYDLAVQLNGDDPVLRADYGEVLVYLGKYAEAEPQLKRAIEVEPLYARSYVVLARAYEGLGRTADAAEQYTAFIQRAAQNHDAKPIAEARLRALASAGGK